MALQGIFFGAHQGNHAGPRERKSTLDACGEIRSAAERGVIHKAVFAIDSRIGGPATQSFPEKLVANSSRGKASLKRLAVKLRKTKAGGPAADVTERLDTMLGKNGKKNLDFEIRVPDGEELVGGTGVDIHERHI